MTALENAKSKGEILTGLLYINEQSQDLHNILNTTDTPLNKLTQDVLCPGAEKLKDINKSLSQVGAGMQFT